jgi:hypothetical protein
MSLKCYRTRYLRKFENELVLLSKTPYLGKSSRQLRTGTVAEQALTVVVEASIFFFDCDWDGLDRSDILLPVPPVYLIA